MTDWVACGVTLRVLDRFCLRFTFFLVRLGLELGPNVLASVDPMLCMLCE